VPSGVREQKQETPSRFEPHPHYPLALTLELQPLALGSSLGLGLWSAAGPGDTGPGDTEPPPQDLFKKVVSYHCLGSIWYLWDKKGKERLALTIRATVTQFNNMVACIVPSYLGDQSTKAQWSPGVECWVDEARVCCRTALGTPLHLPLRLWAVVRPLHYPRSPLPRDMVPGHSQSPAWALILS
jgi:hypothetical protein